MTASPSSRVYESQGLRLHYADWGNDAARPLVLVHGGRDHCRTWDAVAKALQPHFHVLAPDLRGHGDSDWAKGTSYGLSEYVYDLARLIEHAGLRDVTLVGHSMGGMISLMYTGTFPDKVARLVVLDGVTVLPGRAPTPIHEQIAKWVAQLDRIAGQTPRRLASIAEAADRMMAHNSRLTREQALFLAEHGVRRNGDGTFSWKFDDYQQARAPYRLTPEEHVALWQRITCPTLLMRGDDTPLPDPTPVLGHFKHAQTATIAGAGHWLHHDKLDEVVAGVKRFLGVAG